MNIQKPGSRGATQPKAGTERHRTEKAADKEEVLQWITR